MHIENFYLLKKNTIKAFFVTKRKQNIHATVQFLLGASQWKTTHSLVSFKETFLLVIYYQKYKHYTSLPNRTITSKIAWINSFELWMLLMNKQPNQAKTLIISSLYWYLFCFLNQNQTEKNRFTYSYIYFASYI